MRLIVITAPDTPRSLVSQSELGLLHQCFQRGLKHLHLRKPGWPIDRLRQFVREIDVEDRRKIVLHSHHELSEEFEIGVRPTKHAVHLLQ